MTSTTRIVYRWLLISTCLFMITSSWAGDALEVITLQHRLADEMATTIRPFVNEGGVISAQGNQLIIRSSETNIAELKALIRKLDTPLRRLMIHVKQPISGSRQDNSDSLSGQINLPQESAQITLRSYRTADRDESSADQTIQVLEGHAAMIKTGQLIPTAQQQIENGKAVTSIQDRDVSSGFQVIPRLSGDNVTLEILPFSATPSTQGGGIIEQQQTYTTVTGKLGEWIELGGATSGQQKLESGTVYSTHSRNEAQRQIYIMVTELP